MDDRLSAHFVREEAACPCCDRLVLVRATVDLAERLRVRHFPRGLVVRSWFRCRRHNAAVGGAKSSCHLQGLALDIPPLLTPAQVRACGARGVGIDHLGRVVHVDVGPVRSWHYDVHGRVVA